MLMKSLTFLGLACAGGLMAIALAGCESVEDKPVVLSDEADTPEKYLEEVERRNREKFQRVDERGEPLPPGYTPPGEDPRN